MTPPSESRSDAELIEAVNAGDPAAFDALYYRYRDRILALARRFTGNDADALDVTQETFIYLSSKFPGFRLTAAMTTFLYPAVVNLARSARNKRSHFAGDPDALARVASAPPGVDPSAARGELSTAMASLPEAQRLTLLLRFVDDFSLEEIAEALNIPLGTVKSRLHNGLASLRDDPRTRDYFFPESR